jgi:uncharacterized protein YkwD
MRRTPGTTSTFVIALIACLITVACLAASANAWATTSLTVLERQILVCVNAERTARGLRSVGPQDDLMAAARAHSRSMAHQSYFSHYSLGGAPCSLRLLSFGYARDGFAAWGVGEDIAYARAGTVAATPQGVVSLWMQSTAHRRVILRADFRDAGIGIHYADGRRYFTLDLGYRRR